MNLTTFNYAHTRSQRNPLTFLAILTTFLTVITLSGCVGLTSANAPTPNKTASATAGTLAASATSLNFGNVAAGSSTSQALTLTNTGSATVTISQASMTGAGFSVAGGMTSLIIAAGQNHAFQVQFAPQVVGTVNGTISVVSDATNSPLALSLSGSGAAGLSVSAQPGSQSVVAGQPATFSVTATDTAPISYQWKRNGAPISGATSATYSTAPVTASDNGSTFTVTMNDGVATLISSPAVLTVTASAVAPSISTQPANQTVTTGQTASFSVAATGTGTLTYQWKKTGAAIAGATASTYTTPATVSGDNGSQFTVTVTNATGSVTSNPAALTVSTSAVAPSISTQPANQTVATGQTASFSVAATGTGTLTYQWKKTGAAIAGATASTYTTPATVSGDNGSQFTVTVTNATGSVTSNPAALTLSTSAVAPSISTQPANQTVATGQTASFSVAATGTGTLTYQWKKTGAAIAGATASTYTTPATVSGDNGSQFTVTVTNATGSVTSNPAALTVSTSAVAPSISTQPANQTVATGQTASFSVAATGTGTLTYQWKKTGAAIAGATASTYTTPATVSGDNGSQFTVTVTNATGSVTSNPAALTVTTATALLNASTASVAFGSATVGSSSTKTVTFTNSGNSNVTISNVSISGAGLSASGVSTGQILSPGQTTTLSVTFAPSSAGSVTGSVTVSSNATNSPGAVSLSGTATAAIAHSVSLNWAASTSTVVGYNLYRSSVTGGPYSKLNPAVVPSISYADPSVQAGQTYFYVATSVDASNLESTVSNEVSVTVPTP